MTISWVELGLYALGMAGLWAERPSTASARRRVVAKLPAEAKKA